MQYDSTFRVGIPDEGSFVETSILIVSLRYSEESETANKGLCSKLSGLLYMIVQLASRTPGACCPVVKKPVSASLTLHGLT